MIRWSLPVLPASTQHLPLLNKPVVSASTCLRKCISADCNFRGGYHKRNQVNVAKIIGKPRAHIHRHATVQMMNFVPARHDTGGALLQSTLESPVHTAHAVAHTDFKFGDVQQPADGFAGLDLFVRGLARLRRFPEPNFRR